MRSLCVIVPLAIPLGLVAQMGAAVSDTIRAGQFDGGKMWTFEYPPSEYFTETYGFEADHDWFERARMAALRIPGCSASFVSPNGLLATNHHCVRSRVSAVSRPGEGLLDNGFYASSLEDERPIPGYFADQLLAVDDVTDEVSAALTGTQPGPASNDARRDVFTRIEARLLDRFTATGDSIWVQMVSLYNGGRQSAYVFRRFTDIRLVMAVELQAGFFGGDPDNFTYPRYALDFAFLRVYGSDGMPYRNGHHFGWGSEGVEAGDAVFVIGSPGPTNRLTTVAQLEYFRDVQVPVQQHWFGSRHAAMGDYRNALPEEAEAFDIRNRMFSLSNTLKASIGRLAALNDTEVMAKRQDGERAFRDSLGVRTDLPPEQREVAMNIAVLQREKRLLAGEYGAFYQMTSPSNGDAPLLRAFAAAEYLTALQRGTPADSLIAIREAMLSIAGSPPDLERRLLTARLADFLRYLGPNHEITRAALRDGTPEATAAALLAHSRLGSAQTAADAARNEQISWDDPLIALAATIGPHYGRFVEAFDQLTSAERALAGDFGRARFAVYGRNVPPDATSSPRITDGIVKGYSYNGTLAPPYTTFYGIYDRHFAHRGEVDWSLPARWQTPPAGLDLATPLNFVSTADTYGGNSGSPAVTPDLELVGLNFDRNINGLSRDYIYLPEQGRNVMVDTRAIQAALDHAYDADRIVQELLTGRLFATEAEADSRR